MVLLLTKYYTQPAEVQVYAVAVTQLHLDLTADGGEQ
jgi:hypothetical protein